MNRKTRILASCLSAVLSALNPVIVNAESSASQSVNIAINPIRTLYVNDDNRIFGIQSLSDGGYFPENEIAVYRNKVRIPMTLDIQSQYYFLLEPQTAERAGINWEERGYWYHNIDADVWKSYEAEISEDSASQNSFSSSGLRITREKLEDLVVTTIAED